MKKQRLIFSLLIGLSTVTISPLFCYYFMDMTFSSMYYYITPPFTALLCYFVIHPLLMGKGTDKK
ncbi:MAG: hypothetical protein EAZ57_06155 [Cytophagales bacterium]|nr:MAG: hypothetical protein EAZ67_08345 [Cytophagales bacterium]TAF60763.1 MAG: hypothetical protein EAZ57_06155 [Cytophagales bacterium]